MTITSSDGRVHSVGEPEERRRSFEKARNVGAHTGGNWAIRPRAFADAQAFFEAHLGA